MQIFSAFLLAALITGCSSPETSRARAPVPDPNRLEAQPAEVKAAISEIATHVSDNPESILKTVDQTLRNLNQYLEKPPGYLRMDVLSLASKCIDTMEKNNEFMRQYREKDTRPSFSVVAYCIPVEAVSVPTSPTPNLVDIKKVPAPQKPTTEKKESHSGPPYVTVHMPHKPAAIATADLATLKDLLTRSPGMNIEDYAELRSSGQLFVVQNGTNVEYKDISDDGMYAQMYIVNGTYKGRNAWFLRAVLKPPRD